MRSTAQTRFYSLCVALDQVWGGGLGDKRLLEIILQPGELTLHLWK